MHNTALYPDPRKIENIEGHITTYFRCLEEAYTRRIEAMQRHWRSLPASAPSIEHIVRMEAHLQNCILEFKRRKI